MKALLFFEIQVVFASGKAFKTLLMNLEGRMNFPIGVIAFDFEEEDISCLADHSLQKQVRLITDCLPSVNCRHLNMAGGGSRTQF